MALSLHEPSVDVVPGVPGVVVVDASGVELGGISVDRDKPAFVGGRVDVTNRTGGAVGVSGETLIQEAKVRLVNRSSIQVFFMENFYFEISRVPSRRFKQKATLN